MSSFSVTVSAGPGDTPGRDVLSGKQQMQWQHFPPLQGASWLHLCTEHGSSLWGEGWPCLLQIEFVVRLCPWEVILAVRALWWLPGWSCSAQSGGAPPCPVISTEGPQLWKFPGSLPLCKLRSPWDAVPPLPWFLSTEIVCILFPGVPATFLWSRNLLQILDFWTVV